LFADTRGTSIAHGFGRIQTDQGVKISMKWHKMTLPGTFAGNTSAIDGGSLKQELNKRNLHAVKVSAIPPKTVEPCEDSSPEADEITARRLEDHYRLKQTPRPR
jgi:hypothetical protein